jgi:FkbM family methyltransferase
MPAHRECFVKNVTAENVNLYACALGAAESEVNMTTYAGNSGHSHVADNGEIRAQMRTLDSFAFVDVDLIKIDVEGFEYHVLLGARKTLGRCKPTIIVEQKPGNGSRYGHGDLGALQLLGGIGMKIVAKKAGDYILTW